MRNPHLRLLPLVTVSLVFGSIIQPSLAQSTSNSSSVIVIDASGAALPPESGYLKMGGQSSSGHEIRVNSRYLTLDGKPWLPVMGEFHFSRYPEKYWEEEILKMKAGGIQIISTYIFWIHHEEVEGQFDWTGQRDLHHFAELCGKHGMYLVPTKPVDVPSGAYFVWPVNMDLQGANLKYATSQPLCKLSHAGAAYYFFLAVPGVAPEFVFDSNTIKSIDAGRAVVSREGGRIYVRGIEVGKKVAISVRTRKSGTVHIILLSQEQARNIWKASYGDNEYVLFSSADMFFDEVSFHLRARDVSELHFGVFPNLEIQHSPDMPVRKADNDGLFFEYAVSIKPKKLTVQLHAVRTNQPSSPVKMGKPVDWRNHAAVAVPPEDFDHADLWRVVLPKNALDGLSDAFLRIGYVGDTARLYAGPRLLDDDFYKGTVWEIGLKRYAPGINDTPLEVKILPLLKAAPIYLSNAAWPDSWPDDAIGEIHQIDLVPEYEVSVQLR